MPARALKAALMLGAVSTLAACASAGGAKDAPIRLPEVKDPAPIVSGTMRPYQIRGRWYHPKEQPNYDETGMASWYGAYHHGRSTSTGERFDMNALTAAHKTLPLPSLVEVTNTANGRRAILRVNDRGPFVDGRIIDLSKGAADELGLMARGVGEVRVRYVGPAPRTGGGMALSAGPTTASAPVATAPTRSNRRSGDSGPVPYNEVVRAERTSPAPVTPQPSTAPLSAAPSAATAATGAERVYLPGAAPIANAVVPASRTPAPIPAPVPAPAPLPVVEPTPAPVTPPAPVPVPAPVYVAPAPVPAPTPAPVPAPIAVPAVAGHWVQAAAYHDQVTARRFAERLGSQAQVQSFEANGQIYYRILVGPWPDANAAERARQAIIARGYREALLISGS